MRETFANETSISAEGGKQTNNPTSAGQRGRSQRTSPMPAATKPSAQRATMLAKAISHHADALPLRPPVIPQVTRESDMALPNCLEKRPKAHSR